MDNMQHAKWKAAGIFGALVLVFGVGLYAGIHQAQTMAAQNTVVSPSLRLNFGTSAPQGVDFSQLWQAWSLLNENFVETHASSTLPTDQEKVYGAIQGLVSSYGDAYTEFFPPSDAKIFQDNISGSFSGVGMEIGSQDGQVIVIAPLKDSPAEKAGIKSGDVILAIDATSTSAMTVDTAVKFIRGPQGSTVKLIIKRGSLAPMQIAIERGIINIPTLTYSHDRQNGIFTIELYNFDAVSSAKFREALRQFMQSGETRLLLDLRGNPGGYLDASVDMASFFLPSGTTIVTEDYRGKQQNHVHRSLGYNVFANKKLSMAILIDKGSASAAEILAGALQQNGVAKLVGTRSFGKGSVQQLMDLGDGAALKVTVARWLTPNGSSISDGGLTPDIVVEYTPEDAQAGRDPQKDAAIIWLVSQ